MFYELVCKVKITWQANWMPAGRVENFRQDCFRRAGRGGSISWTETNWRYCY